MVEGRGDVEVVEELSVLGHAVRIMLGYELELLQEFRPVHYLELALELTNHVLELVVDDGDAVAVLCVLDDLVSDGGSSGEVHWSGDVSDGGVEDIGHRAAEGNGSFVADYEDAMSSSVGLDHGFDFPDDAGVGAAAQTLVSGDGHKQPLLGSELRLLLCKIGLSRNNLLDHANAIGPGSLQSSHIGLHLGGSHHFHSLHRKAVTLVIFLMDSTAFILSLICLRFLVAKANWVWKSREEDCNRPVSIKIIDMLKIEH